MDKRGVPPRSECDKHGWPFYQTSAAASSAYQSLYSNRDGLRDSYAGFWRRVATEFADEPACLAYELMNEPGAVRGRRPDLPCAPRCVVTLGTGGCRATRSRTHCCTFPAWRTTSTSGPSSRRRTSRSERWTTGTWCGLPDRPASLRACIALVPRHRAPDRYGFAVLLRRRDVGRPVCRIHGGARRHHVQRSQCARVSLLPHHQL